MVGFQIAFMLHKELKKNGTCRGGVVYVMMWCCCRVVWCGVLCMVWVEGRGRGLKGNERVMLNIKKKRVKEGRKVTVRDK